MSCLFPFKRHRLKDGTIVASERGLNVKHNPPIGSFYTPCGQCGECRLSRARTWATRCVHEATYWKHSCFITLTYKDTPPDNSLCPDDTRNFIRRFRDEFKKPFKYFLVGEYGEKGDRPHYHALIFGHDFGLANHHKPEDKKEEKLTSDLHLLHNTEALSCPELNSIWGLGHTSVGHLTFDSAAYCAQYSMKKITGSKAAAHYGKKIPEFMRTSQNAIGKQYALQFSQEIIDNNSVISNGITQSIPQYYLKQYEKNQLDLTKLKITREEFSQTHSMEKSYTRACQLDSKFKLKISKSDAFRIRYAKDAYFKT